MKKILFSVAVAALAFASCEKTDFIEQESTSMGNAIEVNAMIGDDKPGTKVKADSTTTASISSFLMYMYNDDEAVATSVKFSKPTTAGDPWTHSGVYYWAAGDYEFYGLAQNNSADNAISGVKVTKDGITVGTSTAPYVIKTDGDVADPKYVSGAYTGGIYADAVSTPTAQEDPVVSVETVSRADANTGSTITTMHFHHLLSRVRIKLDSYDPKTSNLKLVVYGYEFRKVGVKGYISSDNALTTSAKASSPVWTITELHAVRENSVAFVQNYDATNWTGNYKSLIPSDSWCNVIPGNVATALVVKAAFYDNTNNFVQMRYFTTSADAVMKAAGLLDGSKYVYKPGYQYTYHLAVTSDGGGDTDKENPGVDDPNHDGPDKGLEGLTIKITGVEVTPWVDKNGGTAEFKGTE